MCELVSMFHKSIPISKNGICFLNYGILHATCIICRKDHFARLPTYVAPSCAIVPRRSPCRGHYRMTRMQKGDITSDLAGPSCVFSILIVTDRSSDHTGPPYVCGTP